MRACPRLRRSWQPDSIGTGGLTLDNFRALAFNKIHMLAGGTWLSTAGLGLRPWYLAGHTAIPVLPGYSPAPGSGEAAPAPAPAAASPTAAAPLPSAGSC